MVSTERDTGYQATNTLAGTRINTQVKDVGAALSIYTKDLLTDLGATSAQDLLLYATGAEVGGIHGNFAGNAPGATNASSEGLRNNPQGATRIRGLAAADLARGYFTTDIAFDDYNTSEITVSRGPNAVLFGLGSPSGIINQGLIRPDYRDRGSFTYRVGSNTLDNLSHRTSLDLNRRLIDRKLAVRVAALYEDERFKQQPAFEQDRRAFASVLFEPFKSTALRANYERGRIHANRPSTVLAIDNLSPWFASGKYRYDFAAFDRNPALNAGVAPQIPNALQGRQPTLFNTMGVFYDDSSRDTISRALRLVIPANQQTGPNPAINVDGVAEQYTFYGTANLSNILTGYRDQGFTGANVGVFDWENRMFEGSTAFQHENFNALNLAFEQRALGDRVGIELAFDRQNLRRRSYLPFGNRNGSTVWVDINTTLSNGQPNPNLGRPFVVTGAVNRGTVDRQRDTWQATGFARYDFKDLNKSWGSLLGRHSLTGLAQEQTVDELNYIQKLVLDSQSGVIERLFGAVERPQERQLNRVVYVGPSLLGANSINDVRLSPVDIPIYTPGLRVTGSLWDPLTQNYTNVESVTREILNAGTLSRTVVESYASVLQSHWLKEHLVTLVGWRQDESSRRSTNPPSVPAAVNPNNPFTFDGWSLAGAAPVVVKQDGWTYSVVGRVPRAITRHLPRVGDLSFFFNKSANFSALAGRVDYLNRELPNPEGETKEYGLNLDLFEGKFSVRLNRFETVASNSSGQNLINNEMNIFFGLLGAWDTSLINNGATSVVTAADIARLTRGIESTVQTMKREFNYSVSTNAQGVATSTFRNVSGLGDTTDFEAKGYELDLIFNPTRNWRMLLNVARQETVQSNIAPVVREWVGLIRANYSAVANLPFNGLNGTTVGNRIASELDTPYAQLISQTGTQAFDQRKWRANFVTSYTFPSDSRFKGFNLGSGVRWQDKAIVGYPFITVNGVRQPDFANPTTAGEQLNADAWIGYTRRRVWRNVDWKIQLNVRNLVGTDELIPVALQPDGRVSQYRLPSYATWALTNTFSF